VKKPPEIIFLCGFSGSGKTETGRRLAELMEFDFIDTDEAVEESLGKTIPEIFARLGEARFRFAESDVIRMATQRPPQVIALGGGAIADEHKLDYVKERGYLIYLRVTPESVYERLRDSTLRPLLEVYTDDEAKRREAVMKRIHKLLDEREKYYLAADMVVDTEGKSPDAVANEIKEKLTKDAQAE
jgi:shikimate kinase